MAKTTPKAVVKKKVVKGKKVAKRDGVNKSQAIRDYHKDHPNEGPTAIAKALTAKGIKVVPAQVSNVLGSTGKRKKKKVKKRAAKAAAATAKGSDKVSLGSLVDTQSFVDKVGGVDTAKQLLGAIEKLNR